MGTLNIPAPPAYLVRSPFTFYGLQYHGGQVVEQPADWTPQHIDMLIEGNRIVGITTQLDTVEVDGMHFIDSDWSDGYVAWKEARALEALAAEEVEPENDELSVPAERDAQGEDGNDESTGEPDEGLAVSEPSPRPAAKRR